MSEQGGGNTGNDYLTSKPFLEAKAYINSKGLPLTAENVRRFFAMRQEQPQQQLQPTSLAYTPGNVASPPDAQGGAAPSSNQPGSASAGLAQRMHQSAPQQQPQSQQPNASSDSAMSQPQPQPASSGGGGVLSSLAQMILGGGAGAGLAHLFMGGRSGAAPSSGAPLNIPMPGGDPQLGSGPLQLPPPQGQLPAPPSPGGGEPSSQLSIGQSPVAGVNPIGPPQPGRLAVGPQSSPVTLMPPGAAPASNVASGAPVSILPRELGGDAADLGGHMDWEKILGEIGKVVGRR